MEIKVSNLKPNPFRNIDNFPIDREKVEALKTEIEKDDFWDNIVARKSGKKYEIVYGHHRLEALKELGWEKVDLPVKEKDDDQMLRGMINENLDIWQHGSAYILWSVRVVKEYLDGRFVSCEWGTSQEFLKGLFDSKKAFDITKGMGAGEAIIKKYLGSNWSAEKIRHSLAILKHEEIDRKAVIIFPKLNLAHAFFEALKENPGLPKDQHKPLAELVVKSLGKNMTAKSVKEFAAKKLLGFHKLSNPQPEKVKARASEKTVNNIRKLSEKLSSEIADLKTKSSGKETERLSQYLDKKNIPAALESLDEVCGEVEFPVVDKDNGEEQGKINRVELLHVLNMLKPAVAKTDFTEALVYYYFMEDRIMAHNDVIWVAIEFPIGLTGMVKAGTLRDTLMLSKATMIDVSLSDDGKNLQITSKDSVGFAPILVDEEYCAKIKAKFPEDKGWHEIPSGLFDGLKSGAKFASDNLFYDADYNLIYVRGDKIFSTDDQAAFSYQLNGESYRNFAIPKYIIENVQGYLTRFGLYALKSYRIGQIEDEKEVICSIDQTYSKDEWKNHCIYDEKKVIHFKGDKITVTARATDFPLPDYMGKFFEDELTEYQEGVDLPDEIIETIDRLYRILKQEDLVESESEAEITFRFSADQFICSIRNNAGKELASKKFYLDHGMKEQGLVMNLGELKKIMSSTRHFIGTGLKKGLSGADFVVFGNDTFRCQTVFTEELAWIKQQEERERERLEWDKKPELLDEVAKEMVGKDDESELSKEDYNGPQFSNHWLSYFSCDIF